MRALSLFLASCLLPTPAVLPGGFYLRDIQCSTWALIAANDSPTISAFSWLLPLSGVLKRVLMNWILFLTPKLESHFVFMLCLGIDSHSMISMELSVCSSVCLSFLSDIVLREGLKKKSEFSALFKTHPPHSQSAKKKIKITWSKNHF